MGADLPHVLYNPIDSHNPTGQIEADDESIRLNMESLKKIQNKMANGEVSRPISLTEFINSTPL